MSTAVIDDPTILASSEPQRLSAVSPFVKLVLGFGFLWGIIIGIIGQSVFRFMLEQELSINQTLSIEFSQRIILIEFIVLAFALIISLIALGFVWKAPSRKAAILTAMSVGIIFALTVHALFAGAVNGAIYNRELWVFLHQNIPAEDNSFAVILATSVIRTVQEGMGFGLILLALLSGLGALAGCFLPVDSNQSPAPSKYAFASVAALILPTILLQSAFLSIMTFSVMTQSINLTSSSGDLGISTDWLLTSATLPPMLAGILALLIAIYWAWKVNLETVHRMILRLSQILVALVGGGTLILNLVATTTPSFFESLPGRLALLMIMALSWLYAIVLQIRLREKVESGVSARASNLSLAFAGIAVIIIGYLLMDFFSSRIMLNIVLYNVVLIPEGLQDTVNPGQRVTEILYSAITGFWLSLPQTLGLYVLIAMSIYQPVVWLANKFER